MDNNSLMLVDNHGSFEIDDQAHMDVDATDDNAMTIFNPTTPSADADNSALVNPATQPGRRRRKKSMVWEHFTIETVSPGSTKASCKHCKKSFAYITGSKLAGTSHLKRHIALGICPMSPQNTQLAMTPQTKERSTGPPKKRQRSSLGYMNVPVDQNRCNQEMAKMIIMHEYPLHMVEHPGFAGFVQALQPQFSMTSFNTIHGDCVSMYLSEKQKLSDFIGEIPGRVNLTIDLWTSNQSVGYAFLTGHFIDRDWNLTRRLLNVLVVPSPDSDFALNQPVAACLSDWNLERKLSSLTVDQSVVNKSAVENLRGFLSARNPNVLNGQLLMGKCYARLLSSMAQDMLATEELESSIKRIRDSVKYVKTNDSCEERFDEVKRQLQTTPTIELLIDDQSKWNTTYNMLVSACEHKEVFSCLEIDYKMPTSAEEWRKIENLCSCLKILLDAVNVLTGPTPLTANDLYHEVTKLQLDLSHAAVSDDADIRNLATPLREKFDEFWSECFLVLAVAVVMDPRFKMKLIEFSFTKMYGEDAGKWIKTVDDAIHDLYHDYASQNFPLLDSYVDHENHSVPETEMTEEVHFHQEMAHEHHRSNGGLHDHGHEVSLYDQTQNGHASNGQSAHETQEANNESGPHPEEVQPSVESLPLDCQVTEEHLQECEQVETHAQEQATEPLPPPQEDQPQCEAVSEEAVEAHPMEGVEVEDHSVEAIPEEKQPGEGPHQLSQDDQQANGQLAQMQESQPTDESSRDNQLVEENPQEEMLPERQPVEGDVSSPVRKSVDNEEEKQSMDDITQETQQVEDIPQDNVVMEGEIVEEEETQPMEDEVVDETQPMEDEIVEEDTRAMEDEVVQETQLMEEMPEEPYSVEALSEHSKSEEAVTEKLHEESKAKEAVVEEAETGEDLAEHPKAEEGVDEGQHTAAEALPEHPTSEEAVDEGQHTAAEAVSEHPETEEAVAEEQHTAAEVLSELPESEEVVAQEPDAAAEVVAEEPDTGAEAVAEEPDAAAEEEAKAEGVEEGNHPGEEGIEKEEDVQSEGIMTEEQQQPSEMENVEQHARPHEEHSFTISQVDVLLQEGHHLEASSNDFPLITIGDGFSDFELYISEIGSHQQMKSELDQYLEESLMPRSQDFDVLGWWKLNSTKYPTLSKMAADVLSVPLFTVPVESVFDTRVKKMDSYRSSLRSVTLEALICAKDWFRHASSSSSPPDTTLKREA